MISQHEREYIDRVMRDWSLTPATFAHRISKGDWIAKPHLQYISARVAQGIARGGARIIVSAPPRHGKSELTSVYTPAWVLERFPKYNVILSTYGADLSVGFGRRVRDLLMNEENMEIMKARVCRDSARVQAFQTESGGSMYSVGLGGPITGRGAHVLLIDDYIKEIKEALSPAYRDYIWNWFVTTAYTRLEPGGSVIIVATRWHSDDLIGRILTNFPGEWEYIEIPAEAEEGDILGRAVGEPLFPERYPLERLHELKNTLGSIFYQALFQQKPVDESKKLANGEWLQEVPSMPRLRSYKTARIWDLASTEGGGDYTVGTKETYDKETDDLYIENVVRKQISPGQIEQLVLKTAIADGTDVTIYIEQEPGASGKGLVEHYQRNVLKGFTVKAIPATTKKLIRAQPFLAAAEAGKVRYVKGPWNKDFIAEFDAFPGAFDDQVDTAAAGYSALSGKKAFSASWGRTKNKDRSYNSREHRRAQFTMASRHTANRRVSGATFGR